jgi:hypothetical protein
MSRAKPSKPAAIAIESDALAGLSVELKNEISRFTQSDQQHKDVTKALVMPRNESGRLTWLTPGVNYTT